VKRFVQVSSTKLDLQTLLLAYQGGVLVLSITIISLLKINWLIIVRLIDYLVWLIMRLGGRCEKSLVFSF